MLTITPPEVPIPNSDHFQTDLFDTDGTLTGTTTLGQSVPGNNGNDKVFYTLQSFRTACSLVSFQGYLILIGDEYILDSNPNSKYGKNVECNV